MKWSRGSRSGDLIDARGRGGGGFRGGGLGGGLGRGGFPIPMRGGLPAILILVVLSVLGGGRLLGGGGGDAGFPVDNGFEQMPGTAERARGGEALDGAPSADDQTVDFMSFVLDDVQNLWTEEFRSGGKTYERAKLVIFEEQVQSGCGAASSATGPFYCPADKTAYLDVGFFRDLSTRFDAPGDFAQAYVLAHEIGHHVQNLIGVNAEVNRLSQRRPKDANDLSIRQELQADCLAGVWAHSTFERGLLEDGDLREGLDAAAGVGDDRIQKQATGRVNRESWTHGSSDQRMTWLKRGFDSGDPDSCDTFAGDI